MAHNSLPIYLTPDKKKYYLEEYNKFKKVKNPFWKLDSFLEKTLDTINQNPNVQTLSSCRYSASKPNGHPSEYKSYLYFTITLKAESKLSDFLDIFKKKYKKFNLYLSFHLPDYQLFNHYNNWENLPPEIKEMDFVNNKKYFFINIVHIAIISNDISIHDSFWKDLESGLSNL